MKKIIILMAAAVFATGAVFAQDLDGATDMYNSGVAAFQEGNNAAALEFFQNALTMAQNCGEDGAAIVANCKNVIPSVVLSSAKKAAADKNYDEAIAKAQEASELAEQNGNADVKAQADELLPGLRLGKANTLFQAKDLEGAIPAFLAVLEDTPDNGSVWLRLGSCYQAAGKVDEAIEACKKALELGEAGASKTLSNLYLRLGQSALKDNKAAEAIAYFVESNAYMENGNAYLLAGQAAQKLNKDTDAIGYFEKYLELTPGAKNASDINYTIAALHQKAGNKAKALEYYKKLENDAKYGETAKAQIKALEQ